MASHDTKIIFTGSVGAGTKTAIGTISEVVSRKILLNSDDSSVDEELQLISTMAHGDLQLDDGRKINLCGTLKDWEQFDFKEDELSSGFIGIVLLIDNATESPITGFQCFLDRFSGLVTNANIVVGVTQLSLSRKVGLEDYRTELKSRSLNPPLFEVDIRQKKDVLLLVQALLSIS